MTANYNYCDLTGDGPMEDDVYAYLRELFTDIGTGRRNVDLTDPYECRQLAHEAARDITSDW